MAAHDLTEAARILLRGGIVILPTDTLYGIVGSALNEKTVERIYRLRGRNRKKPMIVLIGSTNDLRLFGTTMMHHSTSALKRVWPGKVSVVLPVRGKKFAYLHRGTKTIAFRMPKPVWLRNLLKKTGPLVAPSANPEEKKPAQNIAQAKRYFKNYVHMYVNRGKLAGKPSTLVEIKNGKLHVLREGAVKIKTRG